jgi:hypothetical protein
VTGVAFADEPVTKESVADTPTPPPSKAPEPPPATEAPPAASEPNGAEEKREPGEGTTRDYAFDRRTGHVYLRAGYGVSGPTGNVREDVPINDVAGVGVMAEGTVGVGISRHVELDLTFQSSFHLTPNGCDDCEGNTLGGSFGATYHVAQGTATDPWIRYGMGYRTADFQGSVGVVPEFVPGRYHGIDIAQLSFGVEFAPVYGFQFGPYIGFHTGTYFEGPSLNAAAIERESDALSPYAYLFLGARVTFDPVAFGTGAEPHPSIGAAANPSF